jgi:large subunit ribosomal protein L4
MAAKKTTRKKTTRVKTTRAVRATRATRVKRTTVKKTVSLKAAKTKKATVHSEIHGLTVKVLDAYGTTKGHMTLPEEVFGAKVNKRLISQAVRVYLANQRSGSAKTKTRGEVEGSTRKIYRQKGTGRARHGGIRAPIFVGGGIVFGPIPRDYSMTMPVSMKHQALASALTSQLQAGAVSVVDGLESLEAKTKTFAVALNKINPIDRMLLIVTPETKEVTRCTRNIADLDVIAAANINTYEVIMHKRLVFMKGAIGIIKDIVTKEA